MEIILGKTAGFCYGVKRAVEGAEEEIKKSNSVIYGLGEIVHNKEVVKKLEKQGMKFVEDIEEANGKTLIRAHGIPKEVYEKAKNKKIEIVDFTCPKVLKIHEIADEYRKMGYYIVLFGSKEHPENIGTISYCGKDFFVINEKEDIDKAIKNILKKGNRKVLIISQTTYSLTKFEEYSKELKENLKKENIEVIEKNTICKATEIRQQETEKIAKQVDYMIIIGGKNSSNTKKLYEISLKYCANVISIETKDELDLEKIRKYEKIGIMAGASTPQSSIDEIIEEIEKIHL